MFRRTVFLPVVATLAVVASACADAPAEPDLDVATAALLADGAERAAAAVDADEPCRALAELDVLRGRGADAVAAGEAPGDVVAEIERVARVVGANLACEDDAADPSAQNGPPPEDEPVEVAPAEDGTSQPTPAPPPEEQRDRDEEGDRDDDRDGPGRSDPRGEAKGHDR